MLRVGFSLVLIGRGGGGGGVETPFLPGNSPIKKLPGGMVRLEID